jgi:RNA-binding protein
MAELTLSQDQCIALRARAHRLDPVVLLGAGGLSEAVLREMDRALNAHGLIKVRAGRLERDERDALFLAMADRLGAARVQVIGHTFVLFRPLPEPKAPARPARPAKATRGGGGGAGRGTAAQRAPGARGRARGTQR